MGQIRYMIAKGLKILLNPPALNHCIVDKTAKVCSQCELSGCNIGRYSYIGYQSFAVNLSVGAFCSIADRCSIGGAQHPMEYVSTSPVFHAGKNILKKNFSSHTIKSTPQTIIENDVWIGQGVFVKAGIRIATGAVIGMGSVVTYDVGPYEIWAGNPAKLIRKRFDDDLIEGLLQSKWWNFDSDQLSKYAKDFDNPKQFLEKWGSNK